MTLQGGLRGRAVWFQGWVQLCLERCGLHGPTQCWPVLQHQRDGPKEWRLLLGSSRSLDGLMEVKPVESSHVWTENCNQQFDDTHHFKKYPRCMPKVA